MLHVSATVRNYSVEKVVKVKVVNYKYVKVVNYTHVDLV